jgi:hypothetical protein
MSDLKEQLSPQQISERDELTKAFREVIASAAGKRVLFWMLGECAIYADAYAGEHTNETNHRLGMQRVGKNLIDQLNAIDPRLYPQLLFDVAELKAMDLAANAAKPKEIEDEE